ncbi:ribosomal protein S12 (mitochondrion) [Paulinella micropora]|uniref:Ribosomal protein S12 n=1 Tax=Paulinella micropora TaxID=1928728 RepID=A0A5K7W0I6_9EUKA|nr:ribosomal protein S12 [Paulinella micropora]BBL86702.1 ribosomal protein S12 [Paulinella micropora]
MPSINQLLILKQRDFIKSRTFKIALSCCPQKKAYCLRVVIRSPKKPNSAKRKTAKVFISSNKYKKYCAIVGIGHNLQKWSNVLLRGGRRRDIPGVRYIAIRGKYDLRFVVKRRTKRSKYGIKRFV